ncbi:MAG: GNAT family N-acetyltransferase [Saprospiraceae bacterium]
MNEYLSVREIQPSDTALIARYWLTAEPAFLQGMGVDLAKMPDEAQWLALLSEPIGLPYPEKKSYCIILQADGQPVGHCNVNKIRFGEEAFMHLHIWADSDRKRGIGAALVQMAIPYFFQNLHLQKLCCEPYALNPAPNRTLPKIGFRLVKTYTTTPGFLNFEQEVNLWEMRGNDER